MIEPGARIALGPSDGVLVTGGGATVTGAVIAPASGITLGTLEALGAVTSLAFKLVTEGGKRA